MEGQVLNRVTLAFESRRLEAEYWEYSQPRMRGQTILAVATVLLLYAIFGFLDPWIVPEVVPQVWAIRAVVVAQCIALILLTRTSLFRRYHQLLLASLPIVGGLGILFMVTLAGEAGRQLYYAALILAVIWTLLFADLRFIYALALCIALLLGYEIIALFINPLPLPVLINNTFFLFGALLMSAFASYTIERHSRLSFYQSLLIEQERRRAEALLLNILPKEITEQLATQSGTIADRFENASILFADIVGFTTLSKEMGPEEMVGLLNLTFSYFDYLADKYGVEKIRTIGDNYMCAAGVPRPRADHARALALMALEMMDYASGVRIPTGQRLQFRIGINSGPVVAGVIGSKKFQYDVWGTVVNTASRMESQGLPGEIQITRATYDLLKDEFICEPRGSIEVKGIGEMETWFLVGRRQAAEREPSEPSRAASPDEGFAAESDFLRPWHPERPPSRELGLASSFRALT